MLYYPTSGEMNFYKVMAQHYAERMAKARTDKERWFCRNTYNMYQAIVNTKTIYIND